MKKILSLILAFVMVIGVCASAPIKVFAEEGVDSNSSGGVSLTEDNEEYIYYTDLFYGYPYYLANDTYFKNYSTMFSDMNATVYNAYKNSPLVIGTGLENALDVITSPVDMTKLITDALGLTDFSYDDALDAANDEFVVNILSDSLAYDTQKAFGKVADINSKLNKATAFFNKLEVEDPSTGIQYSAEDLTLEAFEYLEDMGVFCFVSDTILANLWNELYSEDFKLADCFSVAATEIDIAKAIVVAIMMEDVRIELVDDIIATQKSDTILKQGMIRLKNKLEGGFVSYFIKNYITSKLIDDVLQEVDDFVVGLIGMNQILPLIKIVKKAFDFVADVPTVDLILKWRVLMCYSNDLAASIPGLAEYYLKNAFDSNEILRYENMFVAYDAINKSALSVTNKIAKMLDPYGEVYALLLEAVNNDIESITIKTGITEIEIPSSISDDELYDVLRLGAYGGTSLNKVVSISNGIRTVKVSRKVNEMASIVQGCINECWEKINTFNTKYNAISLYGEHIKSVKDVIYNTPIDERVVVSEDICFSRTFIIDSSIAVKPASDEIQPNTLYCVDGEILGCVKFEGNVSVDQSFTVVGDMLCYGVDKSEFVLEKGVTLTVNGEAVFTAEGALLKYWDSYSYISEGATLVVCGNMKIIGVTTTWVNLTNNGEIVVKGNLDNNNLINIFNYGIIEVEGDVNSVGIVPRPGNIDGYIYIYMGAKFNIGGNFTLKGASYGNVGTSWFLLFVYGELIVDGNLSASEKFVAINQLSPESLLLVNGDVYFSVLNADWVSGFDVSCKGYPCNFVDGTFVLSGNYINESSVTFTKSHTMILNSSATQTVKGLKANNLTVINNSMDGVVFNGASCVTGVLKTNESKITNGENLILNGGSIVGPVYYGDIKIVGDVSISEDLCIEGDLICGGSEITDFYIKKGAILKVKGNANFVSTGVALEVYQSYAAIEHGGSLVVDGDMVIGGGQAFGNWSFHWMNFTNDGNLKVNGNLTIGTSGYVHSRFYMKKSTSHLYVGGNIARTSENEFYVTDGLIELVGNCNGGISTSGENKLVLTNKETKQVIKNSSFATLIHENTSAEGIEFASNVKVTTLFNHNGRPFTLYNSGTGSTFVDYDGDSVKDNVDTEPTVGKPCAITVKSENVEKGTVCESFDTTGGTVVTVTAEPTFKYDFYCWKNSNGTVLSYAQNYSFVAKGDVTVTAYFTKRKRNITVETQNGTLTVPTKAEIESIVTIAPKPDEGCVFIANSITVNGESIEGITFEMPDRDVVLSAEFNVNEYYFALKDELVTAKAIDQSLYSAETVSVLKTAITNAENSLVNEIAKQESENRISELQIAKSGLIFVTGSCGESLLWSYDEETQTLNIAGEGAMYNYTDVCCPWEYFSDFIIKVDIGRGITSIGDSAFSNCESISDVYYGYTEDVWDTIQIGSDNECLTSASIHFHSHDFVTSVTKKPTCTEAGEQINDCTCGDSYKEVLESKGHDYSTEWTVDVEATCISKGSKSHHCVVCGDKADVTNVGYTNHKIVSDVCSVCGIALYTYEIVDDGVCITRYNGIDENVLIPEKIDNLPVVCIKGAFKSCNSVKNVTIPNSVTRITDMAFSYCKSLTSVTIPNSVTSMENHVFLSCTSLENVTIGDGVTTIEMNTFAGCTALKSVVFGSSVESIGWHAFKDCTSLTKITLPDTLKNIGGCAFENCISLSNIEIPDGISVIGADIFNNTAYYNNDNNWENDALYIGNHLIKVKESVSDGFIIKKGTKSIANAFENCINITGISIPDSVICIGSRAFSSCTNLASITIPDSVISICDEAFKGCNALAKIIIPDSVTTLGAECFSMCDALVNVEIGDRVSRIDDSTFLCCFSIGSITIPDSVKRIESNAFYGCTSLVDIVIPDGVTYIGNSVFAYCSTLENVLIGDGVTCIGGSSFEGCTSLTSVVIPNSVTRIESNAFYGCTSLVDIVIPDSVTGIESYVFYECTSLTSVTIGDSVTSIREDAFLNTGYYNNSANWKNGVLYIGNHLIETETSLSGDYVINEGTKCIADYAFRDCTSLTSVTIPTSITNIGYSAFYNCSKLKAVYISDLASWCNIDFDTGYFANPLYLARELYLNGKLVTDLTIPQGITEIKDCAFTGCTSLASVTIPDSVTSIDDLTFFNCSSLKYIFYTGSEADWGNVSIGRDNNSLTSATIHYNATGHSHSVSNTLPSQGVNGERVDTCSVCGYVNSKETLVYVNEYITTDVSKNIQLNQDTNELVLDISACNNLENIIISMDGYTVNSTSGSDFGFYGTGSKVQVSDSDGTQVAEYTLIVRGDVNGDSVCDVLDCMLIELARSNNTTLEGAYLLAGDLAENGQITEDDFNAVVNKAVA